MNNRLEFGSAFGRVFELYTSFFRQLVAYATAFYLSVGLVFGLIVYALTQNLEDAATSGDFNATAAVGVIVIFLGYAISIMVLTAALTYAIGESNRTGVFPPLGETWARVKERLGPLLWTMLVMLLLAIPVGIVVAIVFAVFAMLGGLGVLLSFIAMIALGLLLAAALICLVPTIVYEDVSGLAALKASWNRVASSFWTVLGLILVVGIVVIVAQLIIGVVLGTVLSFAGDLAVQLVPSLVSGVLTLPIGSLLSVVVYQALTDGGTPPPGGAMHPPAHGAYPPAAPGSYPPQAAPGSYPPPAAPGTPPPGPQHPPSDTSGPFV